MSVRDFQSPATRGIDVVGIARILSLQILALLGLAGAVVCYVNWSSEIAWREFSGVAKAAASDANAAARSPAPVEAIKHHGSCPRSA
jgi:hypothetical protein